MKVTLGFSPCPNDCFMFDAIVNKRIDLGGLEFDVHLADVEALNRAAFAGTARTTSAAVTAPYQVHITADGEGEALASGVARSASFGATIGVVGMISASVPVPTPTACAPPIAAANSSSNAASSAAHRSTGGCCANAVVAVRKQTRTRTLIGVVAPSSQR